MKAIRGAWIGVLAIVVGAAGCSSSVANPDSETHWLRACDLASDCESGLSCLCNTCTRACANNSCDDLGGNAACVTPDPSAVSAACSAPSSAAMCTHPCSNDSDCASLGSALQCIGGACLAGASLGVADGGSHVSAIDRCDATPRTLVDPSNVFPSSEGGVTHSFIAIAVNATNVYYCFDSDENTGLDGAVMRAPITGGTPTRVAAIQGRQEALLLTAGSVLFAQIHADNDGGFSGEVVRVPFGGKPPTVLAHTRGGTTGTLATDGQTVYFADQEGTKSVSLSGGTVQLITAETGTLALVGTNLIIASNPSTQSSGSILSVPSSGGTPTTLASNQPSPRLPLGCGADICWLTGVKGPSVIGGTGAIIRQSPGATPETVIEDGADGMFIWFAQQLLSDGASFFVSEFNDLPPHEGTPFRVPKEGGARVSLLENGGNVALDDRCLYMASSVTGITSVVKSYTPPGN